MTEEITKKYVAFSEDALSEQIAKLTEIVNQQANAIQNLSTSIAQLSAARLGYDSAPVVRYNGHLANSHSLKRPTSAKIRMPASIPKLPIFSPPQTKRSAAQIVNGHSHHHVSSKKHKSPAQPPQFLVDDGGEPSNTLEETVEETFHTSAVGHPVDEDRAQDAKNNLLTQLVALRDNFPFDQRISVVRARLCSDWIAIRPEELLARLREAGMSALTRKDFMDSVMDVGPGIVRGRSVKFGRDTRRALAIPRMHFSPDELAIIDDAYLPRNAFSGKSVLEEEIDEGGDLNED